MTKIAWQTPAPGVFIGTVGMLKYMVREPSMTPGWRVWCSFNHPMASMGGIIITVKAPDHDAAIEAAENHFRSFVAELVGKNGVAELLAENKRLRRAVQFYANDKNYETAKWEDGSETPGAIPTIEQGDGSSYCDCGDTARAALKPNTPDTPGA